MTIQEEREIEKKRHYITDNIVVCNCGHSVFLPNTQPVKICTHCNQLVFKNEREKFKFMLSKRKVVERG